MTGRTGVLGFFCAMAFPSVSDRLYFDDAKSSLPGLHSKVLGDVVIAARVPVPNEGCADWKVKLLFERCRLIEDCPVRRQVNLFLRRFFHQHKVARGFDLIEDLIVYRAP